MIVISDTSPIINLAAINQLDLNGLVEFSKVADSTAKLSLLPSDVIINREIWRIQDHHRCASEYRHHAEPRAA